jgi:hypothetical protein
MRFMNSELYALVLEPLNAIEMPAEELAALAQEVEGLLNADSERRATVVVHTESTEGVANAWIETLCVFLPSAAFLKDALWERALGAIGKYMQARYRRPHEEARLRRLAIYGPDGQLLKYVTVHEDGGIADEDVPPEDLGYRQPPRN